jgi:membrane protein YqaA with SNARE-associated domain
MLNFLNRIRYSARSWVVQHARGKRAVWWLAGISFVEASFFPIPPIALLAVMLAGGSGRWFYYSAVTAIMSVAGGVFGYMIGVWFFDLFGQSIVAFYGLEHEMLVVGQKFSDNAFLTIFTAAFTPIPYKLFTISAGLFGINFVSFFFASVAGRSLQYLLFGFLMGKYGPRIGMLVFRYFNALLLALVVIGAISLALILLL